LEDLRARLVEASLAWERAFGNAPSITSAVSELDAALLIGCSLADYSSCMQGSTAVQRGFDFRFQGVRYQVKACRPSGKKGSVVTRVPKPSNYEWDELIWILYNPAYEIQEAWQWSVGRFRDQLDAVTRISPAHMRAGRRLQ
jgi:hypothetical protein